MENQTDDSAPSKKKGGLTVLASIAAVLFVAALGLGTAYFFKMEQASDLQRQVDDLKTAAARMDDEMAKGTPTTPAMPVAKYREIPELGVRYKLTDQVKDLTYSIRSDSNDSTRTADFSTVAISGLENDMHEHPCISQNAPSGIISRYTDGNRMLMGKTVKEVGKKIGNYYYVYSHPEYACSLKNGVPVDGLQESIDAVKAAYDSLEVM